MQSFFSDILGGNWTQFLPSNWAAPSFDWNALGSFEFDSNLQDFIDTVNLTKPDSLLDLTERVTAAEAIFCQPEM